MGLIILTLLGLKYLPEWVKLVWLFQFCPSTLDSGVSVVNLRQQLVGDKYGLTEETFTSISDAAKLNELFKAARIQKFRAEQPQDWDIMDLLFHQLYIELKAATDNCAKNTYPYNFNVE